jgi:hypothetical protein
MLTPCVPRFAEESWDEGLTVEDSVAPEVPTDSSS